LHNNSCYRSSIVFWRSIIHQRCCLSCDVPFPFILVWFDPPYKLTVDSCVVTLKIWKTSIWAWMRQQQLPATQRHTVAAGATPWPRATPGLGMANNCEDDYHLQGRTPHRLSSPVSELLLIRKWMMPNYVWLRSRRQQCLSQSALSDDWGISKSLKMLRSSRMIAASFRLYKFLVPLDVAEVFVLAVATDASVTPAAAAWTLSLTRGFILVSSEALILGVFSFVES